MDFPKGKNAERMVKGTTGNVDDLEEKDAMCS